MGLVGFLPLPVVTLAADGPGNHAAAGASASHDSLPIRYYLITWHSRAGSGRH